MAKSGTVKPVVKPAGRFNLLAAARTAGRITPPNWLDKLPQDLRDEVHDTVAAIAARPAGDFNLSAVSRVLIDECQRRKVEHPTLQTVSCYFRSHTEKARRAQ